MDKQMFVRILNSEMELATGCTEPGAVALTAAEAGGGARHRGGRAGGASRRNTTLFTLEIGA